MHWPHIQSKGLKKTGAILGVTQTTFTGMSSEAIATAIQSAIDSPVEGEEAIESASITPSPSIQLLYQTLFGGTVSAYMFVILPKINPYFKEYFWYDNNVPEQERIEIENTSETQLGFIKVDDFMFDGKPHILYYSDGIGNDGSTDYLMNIYFYLTSS